MKRFTGNWSVENERGPIPYADSWKGVGIEAKEARRSTSRHQKSLGNCMTAAEAMLLPGQVLSDHPATMARMAQVREFLRVVDDARQRHEAQKAYLAP